MQSYDKHVPPSSDRAAGGVTYSAAGADIAMQVRFFKVESVRASHGDMRLKVWLRMYWHDTRLAWDPAAYGGISKLVFKGFGTLWVPDTMVRDRARAATVGG